MQIRTDRNLDLLACRLQAIRAPSGGGFEAFAYEQLSTLLDSAVQFAPGISQGVGRSLVAQAIRGAAAGKTITGKALREALGRAESEYLKQPPVPRVMLTSVSLAYSTRLRGLALGDALLTFFPTMPLHYDRTPFRERFKQLGVREPHEYSWVAVRVVTRSPQDAYIDALDALDFIRGVWNYLVNRGKHLRLTFGASRRPVNRIVNGPVQTVHRTNGRVDGDLFYYEPLYPPASRLDVSDLLPRLRKQDRRVRRGLVSHP